MCTIPGIIHTYYDKTKMHIKLVLSDRPVGLCDIKKKEF